MVEQLAYLNGLIGKRIRKVARVLYKHGDQVDSSDGALEIDADGHVVLLDGAADGESLRVREGGWDNPLKEPLSPENLHYIQKHGKWERVDCSDQRDYREVVGQVLTEVQLLENEHRRIAGARLSVSTRSIWFVVAGDECHVHWTQPTGFAEVCG